MNQHLRYFRPRWRLSKNIKRFVSDYLTIVYFFYLFTLLSTNPSSFSRPTFSSKRSTVSYRETFWHERRKLISLRIRRTLGECENARFLVSGTGVLWRLCNHFNTYAKGPHVPEETMNRYLVGSPVLPKTWGQILAYSTRDAFSMTIDRM